MVKVTECDCWKGRKLSLACVSQRLLCGVILVAIDGAPTHASIAIREEVSVRCWSVFNPFLTLAGFLSRPRASGLEASADDSI